MIPKPRKITHKDKISPSRMSGDYLNQLITVIALFAYYSSCLFSITEFVLAHIFATVCLPSSIARNVVVKQSPLYVLTNICS